MLLKLTNFCKKIKPRLKLRKKRKRYCNAGCYCMLRPEKQIGNYMLIALLRSKKVRVLRIVISFLNCIIHGIAKHFSNILYQLLSLLSLPVITKRQYKSLIVLLLHSLSLKINQIQSIILGGIILLQISKYWLKILRSGRQFQFLITFSLVFKYISPVWVTQIKGFSNSSNS